jgi:hypothetical protein
MREYGKLRMDGARRAWRVECPLVMTRSGAIGAAQNSLASSLPADFSPTSGLVLGFHKRILTYGG